MTLRDEIIAIVDVWLEVDDGYEVTIEDMHRLIDDAVDRHLWFAGCCKSGEHVDLPDPEGDL